MGGLLLNRRVCLKCFSFTTDTTAIHALVKKGINKHY